MLIARNRPAFANTGAPCKGESSVFAIMLIYAYSVLIVRWPGVPGRPLTFFVSPKKVSKASDHAATGLAFQLRESKMGKLETRFAQTAKFFLYPFSASHNWQCQKWIKPKPKPKPKPKHQLLLEICTAVGLYVFVFTACRCQLRG